VINLTVKEIFTIDKHLLKICQEFCGTIFYLKWPVVFLLRTIDHWCSSYECFICES